MNFKKSALAGLIGLSLASSAAAFDADSWEVSGFVKNETAVLQQDGTFNGQALGPGPTDSTVYNQSGDSLKSESTLKLYVNGDINDQSSVHAELNLISDAQGVGSHFKSSEAYTQNDALRELYIDTLMGGDVEIRLGKQQVVWGSADGAKLLDIINPTDYREMAQNTMEDSRIPVWMLNANMPIGDAGNLQLIAAQPRENVFSGLNRDIDTSVRTDSSNIGHDRGNAFILKGVDSITGKTNGFVSIVPDLGGVANSFFGTFSVGGAGALTLRYSTGTTVGGFASYSSSQVTTYFASFTPIVNMSSGYGYDGAQILGQFGASYDTNLSPTAANTSSAIFAGTKTGVFQYMDNATFATFDAFANAKSQYTFDMPDDFDLDLAARFRDSLDNGLNYSLAYAYAYDKNPVIDLRWKNVSGETLTQTVDSSNNNTITLADSSGQRYGGYAADVADGSADGTISSANATTYSPILEFSQTLKRAHNFGASFDHTLDTEALGGVVLRGEFLYQKDVYQPVVDLGALGIGDLVNGLSMEKTDRFKYVLGADITVLTNMLVSAQFIQDRNLDYVDTTSAYNSRAKYTADFAAMHMSNGFKKAEENKEFYSLFLSKPFGPNQLGRWNNILMLEEGGGRWNRFDVEYSFTDQLIGTFELNNYWGDKDTQFGQLEDSSNLQLGVKYLF